jgi:DNA/RNA endonuclease YhcR with UshA esterase domain
MHRGTLWLATLTGLAALFMASTPVAAQTETALSGQVSSTEEGAMEGVVVGAKKIGSTITINVVSDGQGRFTFLAGRLEPGRYSLKSARSDMTSTRSIRSK